MARFCKLISAFVSIVVLVTVSTSSWWVMYQPKTPKALSNRE